MQALATASTAFKQAAWSATRQPTDVKVTRACAAVRAAIQEPFSKSEVARNASLFNPRRWPHGWREKPPVDEYDGWSRGNTSHQYYSKVQVDPSAETARSDLPHDTVARRMSALLPQTNDDGSAPHRPIDRLLGLGRAASRRRSNLMSKAASWDPLGALLLPSSGTQPGDLWDDADRRPADVEMARVVTRCRTLMKAPCRQVSSRCHQQERETRNGLEALHRPTCHHITTEGGCERSNVRTFLDGPFHVTDG